MFQLEVFYEHLKIPGGILAAVIRDDIGCFSGNLLQCSVYDERNVICSHRIQQLPVHDIAGISIDDADEEIPSPCNPQVHDIGVPSLVRGGGFLDRNTDRSSWFPPA
jgi:hypothetical protein